MSNKTFAIVSIDISSLYVIKLAKIELTVHKIVSCVAAGLTTDHQNLPSSLTSLMYGTLNPILEAIYGNYRKKKERTEPCAINDAYRSIMRYYRKIYCWRED